MYIALTFFCALGFSLLHFFSKHMKFAGKVPRSKFLSLAAGVSVAYLFVHLLPELNKYQKVLSKELTNTVFGYIEHHIYLVAMAGLVLFYALEKKSEDSKKSNRTCSIFSRSIRRFLGAYRVVFCLQHNYRLFAVKSAF